MPTKKTWIWIIVAGVAVCVIAMLAVAGAGIYFVATHIETKAASIGEASLEFDRARAQLGEQKPLFELDQRERLHLTRQLTSLPTSTAKPQYLWILVWDPDREGHLVKFNVPFWMLRFGRRHFQVTEDSSGFSLEQLNLDINQLERVGPQLLVDLRSPSGERVLVWTK